MHSLYKQDNLPYLAVKVCPKCNNLVKIEENVCGKCTYNFITKEQEKPVEKKEKPTHIFDQAIAGASTYYTPKAEEKPVVKKEKPKHIFDEAIASYKINTKPKFEEKVEDFETAALSIKDVESKDVLICEKCGAKVIGKQKYCGGCGARVTKRKCPSCNGLIDAKLSFCPLCGQNVQEHGNVEKSKEEVNNTLINFEDTTLLNINNLHKKSKKDKTATMQFKEEELLEPIEINVYRKRTFVIIQMVLSLLVLVSLLFSPLLASTFEGMFSQASDALISGNDYIGFTFSSIFKGVFDLESIRNILSSTDGNIIFSSLPLIDKLVGESGLIVSYVIISIVYVSVLTSFIIVLVTSIVGLTKATPFKGIAQTIFVICLAVSCLLIYPNIFTQSFLGYETWLLYAFAISFLFWFIIKLVFFKENILYKKTHKNK